MHSFKLTANEELNQVCVCVCMCVCLRWEGQKSLRIPANIAALQIKPVASIAGDTLMSYLLRREKERMVAAGGWKREKL